MLNLIQLYFLYLFILNFQCPFFNIELLKINNNFDLTYNLKIIMSFIITIYSIFLLTIIFTAIGFIMFYIFSLLTHKNDPDYPGKKII